MKNNTKQMTGLTVLFLCLASQARADLVADPEIPMGGGWVLMSTIGLVVAAIIGFSVLMLRRIRKQNAAASHHESAGS